MEFVVWYGCPGEREETALVQADSIEAALAEPDDLGCPALRARPLAEVKVLTAWTKNGVVRLTVEE